MEREASSSDRRRWQPRSASLAARLSPLAEIGRLSSHPAGATLYRQGEPSDRFSVLLSGRAKMTCLTPGGRSLTLALFGRGDVIGFGGALSGRCRRASVYATEPCSCHDVERARLFRLFRRRPETIERLLPELSRGLEDCKRCFLELVSGRVEQRMARLFVELAGELGRRRPEGVEVPLHLSRQDLADLAGTTVETSIRVMSRWSQEGLVETRRDSFIIAEPGALRRLIDA